MFVCENESCRRGMSEAELDVHTKCHVPNMEGFRCFICQFMCLHWRNMRHHYRKVHDQMLTKVACDYELCTKEFPRIAALRSHVTMIHIKPPLTKMLSAPDADLSEFSTYLEKKKIQNKSLGGSSEAVQGENQDVENDDDDDDDEEEEEEEEETPRKRGPGRPPKRKRPVGRPPKHEDPPKKRATYAKRLRGEDREKFQSRLVAFVCDVCHAKYNQEDVMLSHKYAHFREGSEQIHCTECSNFVAEAEDVIRMHMSAEHRHMLQLHRCDKCNFSSNRYHDLKKHRIVHTGAKDYMCDKCGKCTTTPYNLKVHYRRMHATDQEKNIKCISCEYRCADKAVLKDHIRQKHGLLINGDEYQNPRAMLLFPCTMCPYIGRKQSSLDYHMRIHKENRQFKCHLCPYASKTKNNLVLHIRTHEGMQPVKCPHCDFRGATNKIISEHVMCKHAKARPYQCNICHWTTAYSGNMWKHVDTHQKELGDKMPEFPVSVISTDGHAVPTPLRAPSGKKRANKAGGVKLKVLKGKNRRQRTEEQQQGGLTLLEDQGNVQSIQVTHVQPDDISGDGVVMHVPVATVMHPGQVMVAEGLSEEEAIGSTALSKLAAAVASAQEVHIISTPHPGMDNGANSQAQVIIAGSIPTSIQVATSTGIQEIVEYTVPSVAVSHQVVDSAGNMTHIISDHLYHANQHNQEQQQHHHHQQQQHHQQQLQQQQHHQQHANGGSIQQAAIHAGIPTVVETVPTAVVEQIVQDTPHPEDQSVQQLVATMIPHEAELVMSMMQSQHVQHVQHLQQPNVSQ
ncbi:uncharacterized protein [Diadema antillarum]|uniref:uncharacterized protein n=1 Tax=Diadema antillarum TaxID=105358 RepID=UPI003A87B4D9